MFFESFQKILLNALVFLCELGHVPSSFGVVLVQGLLAVFEKFWLSAVLEELFLVLLQSCARRGEDLVPLPEQAHNSHFKPFLVLKEHEPAHIVYQFVFTFVQALGFDLVQKRLFTVHNHWHWLLYLLKTWKIWVLHQLWGFYLAFGHCKFPFSLLKVVSELHLWASPWVEIVLGVEKRDMLLLVICLKWQIELSYVIIFVNWVPIRHGLVLVRNRLAWSWSRFGFWENASACNGCERDLPLRFALVSGIYLPVIDCIELLCLTKTLVMNLNIVIWGRFIHLIIVQLGVLILWYYLRLLDVEVWGLKAVLLKRIEHTLFFRLSAGLLVCPLGMVHFDAALGGLGGGLVLTQVRRRYLLVLLFSCLQVS